MTKPDVPGWLRHWSEGAGEDRLRALADPRVVEILRVRALKKCIRARHIAAAKTAKVKVKTGKVGRPRKFPLPEQPPMSVPQVVQAVIQSITADVFPEPAVETTPSSALAPALDPDPVSEPEPVKVTRKRRHRLLCDRCKGRRNTFNGLCPRCDKWTRNGR